MAIKTNKLRLQDSEIEKLEQSLFKTKEKLANLRKKRSLREISDYEVELHSGKKAKLSTLFGNKNEMILIHNMGSDCPYCTLWADGFNGIVHHLNNRAAFVVESDDSIKTQKAFAKKRNWKFKFVSTANSNLKKDLGFLTSDGMYVPGASGLVKKGSKIFQTSRTVFGPGDEYCVAWDLMNLLPKQSKDWHPKFRY